MSAWLLSYFSLKNGKIKERCTNMTKNVVNFCVGLFFYNLNVELFLLNSTVLPHCSRSFQILHFCLHRPSFWCRLLIVVRKRKAFLEFMARELKTTCSLGWGFILQRRMEVDNWAVTQTRYIIIYEKSNLSDISGKISYLSTARRYLFLSGLNQTPNLL